MNGVSLNGWFIKPTKIDIKTRYYEVELYNKGTLICKYKRVADADFELDAINYRAETRYDVANFVKELLSILGDNFKEGTKVFTLRRGGYYGNIALITEVLIIYTRMVTRLQETLKNVPKDCYAVYVMANETMFDSPKFNDTNEFVTGHPEKDRTKLTQALRDEANRMNIVMRISICAPHGVNWNIPLKQFMALYKAK